MQGDRGAVSVMGPPFRALPAAAPRSACFSSQDPWAHDWILWQASVKYGQIPQHGLETNVIDIFFSMEKSGPPACNFFGENLKIVSAAMV